MRFLLLALIALCAGTAAQAQEWRVHRVDAPARVSAIETVDGQVRAMAGGLWYALKRDDGSVTLDFIDTPAKAKLPDGALPDGKVASGEHDIARAWLAEPTERYDHGILGDKIEAGALAIETRAGKRQIVRLKGDAVFEDLEPRIADLNGDGHDDIVVVKSYLKRGSALAVIAERKGKYEIVAETPPLGGPHRWLDPAGIADFTGDRKTDIALVRQPHVIGELEIWQWRDGRLQKVAAMPDTANHVAGTRALDMTAVGDFDGDGIADIAIPSLDRTRLRIVSFSPHAREIANVKLPAKAVTNLGLLKGVMAPAVALGLADGSLVVVQRQQ
jgi:FG-GAP-like repeat